MTEKDMSKAVEIDKHIKANKAAIIKLEKISRGKGDLFLTDRNTTDFIKISQDQRDEIVQHMLNYHKSKVIDLQSELSRI